MIIPGILKEMINEYNFRLANAWIDVIRGTYPVTRWQLVAQIASMFPFPDQRSIVIQFEIEFSGQFDESKVRVMFA